MKYSLSLIRTQVNEIIYFKKNEKIKNILRQNSFKSSLYLIRKTKQNKLMRQENLLLIMKSPLQPSKAIKIKI